MTPQQLRVRIDIDHFDRGQLEMTPQHVQLGDHFVAEIAALAVENGQLSDGDRP